MLLLAGLVCTSVLASVSGVRLDCRCGEAACSCLVIHPNPGDLLCAHTSKGRQCSPVEPDDEGSSLVHLLTGEGTVNNLHCKCGGKFCACSVVMSSMEDRICLHSSNGPLCNTLQKAAKPLGLLSRLITKVIENHDSCKCSGDSCICSLINHRPDNVVCLHSAERLACTQLVSEDNNQARLTTDDGGPLCSCSNALCTCEWGTAGSSVEVCVYSDEDTRCHAHQTRDRALPHAATQMLQRFRRSAEPKMGCYCTSNVCSCVWGPPVKAGGMVCLHPSGVCDPIDTLDDHPQQRLAANSCSCSSFQCTCRWLAVKKGNHMCYHHDGVMCIAVELTH